MNGYGSREMRRQNCFMDLATSYQTLKDYADARGLGIGELQRRLHLNLANRIRAGRDVLAEFEADPVASSSERSKKSPG